MGGILLRRQKPLLICRYIEACAAYKWGLTSSGEIVQKVRLRRDSYLVDVVLQAVENGVSNVPHTHQTALNRGLQTIADLDALSASLQALDDFTYVAVRYSAQLWCPCFYLPQKIYIYIYRERERCIFSENVHSGTSKTWLVDGEATCQIMSKLVQNILPQVFL